MQGAGPTGALAALALAEAGWRVQLHDPLSAEELQRRSRAYALTQSSRELLESLSLWQPLGPALAPFRQLHLIDQAIARQVLFRAGAAPSDAVGWILQHAPLMALLLQRVQGHPRIEAQLGGGTSAGWSEAASPDLVLAADGPASPARRAAGLSQLGWRYRQGCLSVQVRLRGSAPDQAWELFRPQGPFAVLPLGGDAFQLVWSAPLPFLQQLEQRDPVAFLDALSAALPIGLQAEVLLDQPQAYPVSLALAWPMQRGNLVLVGEAAHRCHPVGGQGLNLCWRDVALLQQLAQRVVAGRLPVAQLPRRYGRGRWLDVVLVLAATDALVRLFSNRQPLLLPVRHLGLALLARSSRLRNWALRAMSDGPCRLLRP